jgi:hypothetical protein
LGLAVTTVAVADFRTAFPEFGDATVYPDGAVTAALATGSLMVDDTRWQGLAVRGVELYAAHTLVLSTAASKAAARGQALAGPSGPIASKGVGPASVSYDTTSGVEEGAGVYNLTVYGRQFWQLAQMAGAGGLQL